MQPFEIIKVRLQTQSKQAPQYSGIIDCLGKIIKNEGPLALYKGTLSLIKERSPLLSELEFWDLLDSASSKTSKRKSPCTRELTEVPHPYN